MLSLLVDEKTKEPYLRLPYPLSNIILTPPRFTDAEAIVPILNDPRIYKMLEGLPKPYLLEHAKLRIAETSTMAQGMLQELEENPGAPATGCPVRILREVKENGEEVYIGDCWIGRHLWVEVGDEAEKAKAIKKNDSRPAGDPETIWCIRNCLAPSHHGKGIMTVVVRTLIEQWMVPRMAAKKIKATAWTSNKGSVRVFEKNGFVLEQTLDDWKVYPESEGGGTVGMYLLGWQR